MEQDKVACPLLPFVSQSSRNAIWTHIGRGQDVDSFITCRSMLLAAIASLVCMSAVVAEEDAPAELMRLFPYRAAEPKLK